MHPNARTETKRAMRDAHTARRRELAASAQAKRQLDDALVDATLACIDAYGARGTNIAVYSPLPSEPGPLDFAARLAGAARTVFLPISLPRGILSWAVAGESRPGALGIAEPAGARFNSAVLRSCGLVVAPALAVDRRGMRLGKGAGYYDRALSGLSVPVAAVVYDTEVVPEVASEAHDQPVQAVITPSGYFLV